jgi:hypothetical protein
MQGWEGADVACPGRDPMLVPDLPPRDSFGQQDRHKAPSHPSIRPLSLQDCVYG